MTNQRLNDRLARLLPVSAAVLASASFPILAFLSGQRGFPLDDAWIHQTYARNLAQTGQLAYLPGQPSAGSTSPAWSFLLSVGYMLGIDYRLWAYLLGGLALAATAWFTYRLFRRLSPSRPAAALLIGLLCATEWHLVWASASGMETILFTALSLALIEYYFVHTRARSDQAADGPLSLSQEQMVVRAIGIGLLGGALALTRPEGLGLAGLVLGASAILTFPHDRQALNVWLLATAASLVSFAVILAPYVAFNLRTSGSIFPNTLYAKQAEYRIYLQATPLPLRLWHVLSPTLAGPQVLLIPGFCYAVFCIVRDRRWRASLPLVWWLAFLLAYTLYLPVSYQHGRYVIPSIPLLILYGGWGTVNLLQPRSPRLVVRVLSRAAPPALALLAAVFMVRGAFAYRDDVAFVQGEMVATARWLNQHTEPGSLLAVHDIGAVGYFTDRPLLDLAGLITPEVIPFIDDADRLVTWMVQRRVSYAVFFPDFSPAYVELAADPRLQPIHCTDYDWTRRMGHRNMCVYRLDSNGAR